MSSWPRASTAPVEMLELAWPSAPGKPRRGWSLPTHTPAQCSAVKRGMDESVFLGRQSRRVPSLIISVAQSPKPPNQQGASQVPEGGAHTVHPYRIGHAKEAKHKRAPVPCLGFACVNLIK